MGSKRVNTFSANTGRPRFLCGQSFEQRGGFWLSIEIVGTFCLNKGQPAAPSIAGSGSPEVFMEIRALFLDATCQIILVYKHAKKPQQKPLGKNDKISLFPGLVF